MQVLLANSGNCCHLYSRLLSAYSEGFYAPTICAGDGWENGLRAWSY